MPYLTSSRGMRWHYEDEGKGPGLLFLHGWGVDRRIWRQQFKVFSRDYRTVALDLPGHGQSEWRPSSLADMAEDIRELFLRENGGWRIVASSLGGLVAFQLAACEPSRIRALVFVGSLPKFVQGEGAPYGLTPARIMKLKEQLRSDYPVIVRIFFRSLFTQSERNSRRYKWIQTFRRQEQSPDRDALTEFLDILATVDLRPVLSRCRVPVHMINGTEDYICPRPVFEQMKKDYPALTADWLPDCGHFPFLTKPYEFNDKLKGFLDRVGGDREERAEAAGRAL
ncbi:MAG: alpha/beta fold hydrolase [Candidatus Omnitrophota bacterium]|jgi:pimeloyl-[acyl-carrier protein] methyl ester esterase